MCKTGKQKEGCRYHAVRAITSFVCGITEPLEFCFIFAAPVLFLIHAVIAGLGFAAMNLLGAHLGFSFSGGSLDYLFFNVLTNRSNWWIVIPVGIALFAIYYFLFTFAIKKWNLKTPGREAKKETDVDDVAISDTELITKVIEALGGSSNIVHVNAAIQDCALMYMRLVKWIKMPSPTCRPAVSVF